MVEDLVGTLRANCADFGLVLDDSSRPVDLYRALFGPYCELIVIFATPGKFSRELSQWQREVIAKGRSPVPVIYLYTGCATELPKISGVRWEFASEVPPDRLVELVKEVLGK